VVETLVPTREALSPQVLFAYRRFRDNLRVSATVALDQAYGWLKSCSYTLIFTREQLLGAVAEIEAYHAENAEAMICLDVETTHCLPIRYKDEVPRPVRTKKGLRGKATLMQIGLDPDIRDRQFILDIRALNRDGVSDEEIGDLLRPTLESAKILGHNLKYEYQFMWRQFRIKLRKLRCTMLFAQVLYAGDEMVKFGLAKLCGTVFGQELYGWFIEHIKHWYGVEMDYGAFAKFKEKQQKSDWSGPLDGEQIMYAAHDVALPFELWKVLMQRLDEFIEKYGQKMPGDITDEIKLEWDCIPAFAMMELRGFQMDIEKHRALCQKLLQKMEDAENEVGKYLTRTVIKSNGKRGSKREEWEEVETINLRSPKQVKENLSKLLGKTIPNTEADTLKRFKDDHPAVEAILAYKEAEHLYKNFGQKLLDLCEDTGRLHYSIFQCGTDTGRSSMGDPNLQQIPKAEDFRRNFVAGPRKKLQISDFSQIEPRLTASYTGDLVEEFKTSNGELDLHAITGRDMLGLDYLPKKLSDERDVVGKRCNLGLGYRMGYKKLALDIYAYSNGIIDWTVNNFEEAKKRIENYWSTRVRTKKKMEQMDKRLKERALLAGTLAVFKGRKPIAVAFSKLGRPRRFCLEPRQEGYPDEALEKSPKYEWGEFEARLQKICTAAWNHESAQSCAASLMKRAVLAIHNEFEERGFDYDEEGLIAVVHDEAICETFEERAEDAAEIVERNMVEAGSPLTFPVACLADTNISDSWWGGKQ
jgi:DNA polymerase I-like protein with 3'-5' exonuclease and polymerase domains